MGLRGRPAEQDLQVLLRGELGTWGRDPRLATRVLGGLARERRADVAEQVLNCMRAGLVEVNVFHCTSVLNAYGRDGQWQSALSLLSRMPEMHVAPNEVTCNAAISACEKGCQWEVAVHLLGCMPAMGLSPDAISFSAVISACEKGSRWQVALSLLGQLPAARLAPDTIAYSSAISACEKGGQWQLALGLLGRMPAARLVPDEFSYSAAISACEKGGQWLLAFDLLGCMPGARLVPNEISCSAVISACEKGGQWRLALGLLGGMVPAQLVPNEVSYSAAISACEKGGAWQFALHLLDSMPAAKLIPGAISFSAAISACTREAQWQQSLGLLATMRGQRLEPTGIMLGTALSGMARGGHAAEVPAALERLRVRWAAGREEAPDLAATDGPWHRASSATSLSQPRLLLQAPGIAALSKPFGMSTQWLHDDLSAALKAGGHTGGLALASRLDASTSGVLPVALGGEQSGAAQWLHAQFAARQVSKEYVCLCAGPPFGPAGFEGRIDAPLLKPEGAGQKAVLSPLGKEARTRYQVLEVFPWPGREDVLTLLRVSPETGRQHQIRIHLASIGRPVLGDAVYGGSTSAGGIYCPRLFLHCSRMAMLDLAGAPFRPEAPLPSELLEVLSTLRQRAPAGVSEPE